MNLKKTLCMVALMLPCFVGVVDAQSKTSGDFEMGVGTILKIILLIIAPFCFREVICWYFKTNRIVALMEEQNNLLKQLSGPKDISGASNINGTGNEVYSSLPSSGEVGDEYKGEKKGTVGDGA